MSRNIYFKNWKNKNKPTNIVLVYHTKIYFNVAMWVFVSLWLQCEAVWKAGWARRTTDTEEETKREKEVNKMGKNTTIRHSRCVQFLFQDTWHAINVGRSLFFFVLYPVPTEICCCSAQVVKKTRLNLLNTNTWTALITTLAACFNPAGADY